MFVLQSLIALVYSLGLSSLTSLKDHLKIMITSLLRPHINMPVVQFYCVFQLPAIKNNFLMPIGSLITEVSLYILFLSETLNLLFLLAYLGQF